MTSSERNLPIRLKAELAIRVRTMVEGDQC